MLKKVTFVEEQVEKLLRIRQAFCNHSMWKNRKGINL